MMTLPVPVADKSVTLAAIDIFSTRLKALGIGTFTVSTGETMKLTLTVPDSVDQGAIDAVLRTPGVLEFVPWPANGNQPAQGVLVPDALEPLFDFAEEVISADVRTDSSGQPAIDIKFGAAGAEALGSYTTQHVGVPLPIALDGKVLTAPFIQSPITDGEILITGPTVPDSSDIPLEALAAIIASGPLPAEWRHLP